MNELRVKTKVQRQKREELKAKRKAILAARLAKVKRRKLIREGKDPDTIMDEGELHIHNVVWSRITVNFLACMTNIVLFILYQRFG